MDEGVFVVVYWCMLVWFFKEEDGIRDIVRCGGVGDVEKR